MWRSRISGNFYGDFFDKKKEKEKRMQKLTVRYRGTSKSIHVTMSSNARAELGAL
jgi:hypothetical protein